MIYQCSECDKLYDEDDGYMANTSTIGFAIMSGGSMVFICKNCMSEKGRKKLEELKK